MASVNWNHQYGFPGHQITNEGYGHGQELTVSPLEVISAFGTGPEAWSTVAGLWREKEHAGEAQSEEFMTKSTRGWYLRLWERTAELGVASASAIEARKRGTTALVALDCEQRMGIEAGLCSGLYRPAGGGNREGKRWIGRFP